MLLALLGLAAGCASSPDAAPEASTPPGTGNTPGTEGELLAAGQRAAQIIDPAGDTREQEWLCIGVELQRDPALGEAAQQPLDKADVATRKKLLRVVADCVGPDAMVDVYVVGHDISGDRRACVKQLMLARSLDEQIAAVAGDGDAGDVFAKRVAAQCPAAGTGTTGTTGAAGAR